MKTKIINVNLPENSYKVHVACGLLADISSFLNELNFKEGQLALFSDEAVFEHYGQNIKENLEDGSYNVFHKTEKISETQKTVETVTKFYDFALQEKLERKTPVLALGGGVTGDLIGFFAATYLRGVPFIQIPTTLLAMVDSSVGGKVAYNHPMGKNMIGAFYQPKAVFIDPLVLKTLPKDEFSCGLAECIKHALLDNASLFDWMEQNIEQIMAQESQTLEELIARNVQIKASIVVEDEKEQGRRALLNLGHTFGHAIEVTSGYGNIKHGEAVALGCIAASYVSEKLGHISTQDLERVIELTKKCDLPVQENLKDSSELYEAMTLDKKVEAGKIRLILLKSVGDAYITDDTGKDLILEAFEFIKA